MGVRAPHLYDVLRAFCLAAFATLAPEAAEGDELPFVLDRHRGGVYEYRPLVRALVEARAFVLAELPDARIAIDELRRDPAAAIFARGDAGPESSEGRALFRAVLLPLLVRTAEGCGGFDWEDGAFERVYADFERTLFGATRAYLAAAPLVGLSVGEAIELGRGMRLSPSSPADLAARWPESAELLPPDFGAVPERSSVLELERELAAEDHMPPDAPGEIADAVTALRLATGAPVAAGPVVFERLDWHPLGVRPVLGIAATEPGGEPTRLDPWRGSLAGELLDLLAGVEDDPELAEAGERWELSLFEGEPLRSERLRESLAALAGGVDGLWAAVMRVSVLLVESGQERAALADRLRALSLGQFADDEAADAVRRALVETLVHGDRARLLADLDEALLGLRPRPLGYYGVRAIRHDSGTAA